MKGIQRRYPGMNWMHLAQGRVQGRTIMNMTRRLKASKNRSVYEVSDCQFPGKEWPSYAAG